MSKTNPSSKPEEPGRPFTTETTMDEAMAADPNLPVVLMKFHIGGCSLCGFEPGDTIAKVAEDNGIPVDRLLEAMNSPR